jgi:hypothetical protein
MRSTIFFFTALQWAVPIHDRDVEMDGRFGIALCDAMHA